MAVYANIPIDQGSDYNSTVTIEGSDGLAFDLSAGYTVRAQIRKSYTSVNAVAFTAVVSNASLGEISLSLSSTQTGGMKAGRYLYDVEIVNNDSGAVTRVVEGQVEINPRITRLS